MDVIIENTDARLHGISRSQRGDQAGALVQPCIVNLKPGINVVDAELWKEATQQKMVQTLIKEGIFNELKEVGSLAKLAPNQAEKYIELSVDSKMLMEWRKDDKRVKVRKMLDDRLEQLEKQEPGTKPNDKIAGGARRD